MPSSPNATRPNANTASYCMNWERPWSEKRYAPRSSPEMARAFQNTEKLPATMPERMVSEAPPSRVAATISRVWRLLLLVNTLVNSGIRAAASVPQEMMLESFHHKPLPRSASIQRDTTKVTKIESSEAVHTRLVSGASKANLSLPRFCERDIA